ncbi:MAG: PEGA domain-containing protein, partial [Candidatus Methylomirabilaceae bacterium]
ILGGIGGSAGKGAAIGAVVGAMAGALTGNAIQNEQAARAYPPGPAYGAPLYPYVSPYPAPPGPATATLQIEATPGETEIVVDGRRIGLAREFQGPALVPVAAGPHVVEFRWEGFSVMSQVVVPTGATIPIRRDLAPSASLPPPRTSSGADRPSSH